MIIESFFGMDGRTRLTLGDIMAAGQRIECGEGTQDDANIVATYAEAQREGAVGGGYDNGSSQ